MSPAVRSTLLILLSLAAPAAHTASCQISATDLVFGQYRFNSGVDVETTATISIESCVADVNGPAVGYTIAIGAGGGGNFPDRAMSGPGSQLLYNLYADASRTQVWGDGSGGTVTVSGSFVVPLTTSASHTAFGRIPSGQPVAAGFYSDLLTISIEY